MKKIITALTAAALLTSCAWQDKGFVGPGGGENDKVMSVEQAETKEVSALYEGYEELQGKQIGDHIIMPEVITPQEIDKVYIFNREDSFDKTNIEERGTEFFKSFFGENFNADRLYYDPNEDDPNSNPYLRYNSNSPDLPEGIWDPDDHAHGAFCGYPLSAQKNGASYWVVPENVIAEYDPVKDKDTVMKLDDGECTVGEVCQTVMDFLDREFKGFEGIEPVIKRVSYHSDEEGDQPVLRANVYCVLMREGIPLFDGPSSYWYEEPTDEGKMYIQYIMIDYSFNLGGKDNILTIDCGPGPQKATSIKEVDDLIPLRTAAELLDENLAEKLLFKLSDVQLCYCQKITTYSHAVLMDDGVIWYDGSKEKNIYHEHRPTWVFYFADNKATFLVDAITGEITIAASQEILYEMHMEQRK